MKRITRNIPLQKDKICLYTQEMIKTFLETPLTNSADVLHKSVIFFRNEALGENILKQSFLKGFFPRLSYTKQSIVSAITAMETPISKKVELAIPKEYTDFRFINEMLTSNAFAESSTLIQRLIMNSENTKNIKAFITTGNVNKDITVVLLSENGNVFFEKDIKAGNNANNPFSGIVASVPYQENGMVYYVTNDKAVDLTIIQEQREMVFKTLLNSEFVPQPELYELREKISYLRTLYLNIMQKNILIQEELLRALSNNIISNNPSFYTAYTVKQNCLLNERFFEKMEPYINNNIFNDKKTFNIYASKALKVYNESVTEILHNLHNNRNLLKESGLDQIANDIFT